MSEHRSAVPKQRNFREAFSRQGGQGQLFTHGPAARGSIIVTATRHSDDAFIGRTQNAQFRGDRLNAALTAPSTEDEFSRLRLMKRGIYLQLARLYVRVAIPLLWHAQQPPDFHNASGRSALKWEDKGYGPFYTRQKHPGTTGPSLRDVPNMLDALGRCEHCTPSQTSGPTHPKLTADHFAGAAAA